MPLTIDEIPVDAIESDETARPASPRLVQSLQEFGLLEPIYVIQVAPGRYQLVDGSRRLAAVRQLNQSTITALIALPEDATDPKDLRAIVINTERKNLQQIYLAQHAYWLVHQEGRSQAQLAREIHIGKSTLNQMLKVFDCPDLVATFQQEGIEFGAAKALTPLPPEERAALLAVLRERKDRDGRFPIVREVERLVQERQGRRALVPPTEGSVPSVLEALRGRGVPIDVRVGLGKQTRVRIVLTVGQADEEWLADLVSDSNSRAADRQPLPPTGRVASTTEGSPSGQTIAG